MCIVRQIYFALWLALSLSLFYLIQFKDLYWYECNEYYFFKSAFFYYSEWLLNSLLEKKLHNSLLLIELNEDQMKQALLSLSPVIRAVQSVRLISLSLSLSLFIHNWLMRMTVCGCFAVRTEEEKQESKLIWKRNVALKSLIQPMC